MKKSYAALAVLVAALGLALAACGGSGGNGYGGSSSGSSEAEGEASSGTASAYAAPRYGGESESSEPAATGSEGAATVAVGSAAGVGKVLVDSNGLTLYYFEKDRKGSGKSTCSGPCAAGWPPLTTSGEPQAMAGVSSSMLGTIERSDGT
ncbi:MAG: hypothetical protein ACM3NV_09720, partial [Syntrophothermus sp.]